MAAINWQRASFKATDLKRQPLGEPIPKFIRHASESDRIEASLAQIYQLVLWHTGGRDKSRGGTTHD